MSINAPYTHSYGSKNRKSLAVNILYIYIKLTVKKLPWQTKPGKRKHTLGFNRFSFYARLKIDDIYRALFFFLFTQVYTYLLLEIGRVTRFFRLNQSFLKEYISSAGFLIKLTKRGKSRDGSLSLRAVNYLSRGKGRSI